MTAIPSEGSRHSQRRDFKPSGLGSQRGPQNGSSIQAKDFRHIQGQSLKVILNLQMIEVEDQN